jgi:hypothetical protein
MKRSACVTLVYCSLTNVVLANEPPPYKSSRFDEDYRYLQDATLARDIFDPIKVIPLFDRNTTYLSFGGELRERFEHIDNPRFGLVGLTSNDYVLHRLLLHADVHVGDSFRAFAQLGSHFAIGKRGELAPVDDDALDLQQGFIDVAIRQGIAGNLVVRAGRQELSFGSSRLVGVRESPNVRRSFDGLHLLYRQNGYAVDALATRPVALRRGVFDDTNEREEAFWGLYAVGPLLPRYGAHLDLYYLGLKRNGARYFQGTGTERRHSIGARLWGEQQPWDYNWEFVYQFGRFGTTDIDAWTLATETGYTFRFAPWQPRLSVKLDYASGDDDPKDGALNTFNPLYPKLAYFTENSLFVPANLYNFFPAVEWRLAERFVLRTGWDWLWRASKADTFYLNPLVPLAGSQRATSHYIGSEATLDLEWKATRHLQVNVSYVHFLAGASVRAATGKDVDFVACWASYRF